MTAKSSITSGRYTDELILKKVEWEFRSGTQLFFAKFPDGAFDVLEAAAKGLKRRSTGF